MKSSFNLDNRAALIMFDFAAAFPSIARAHMWMALSAMQFPLFVIRALQSLYSNNHHYFQFAGMVAFAFTGAAGVRQGCPASSSL
eukprot:5318617-Heterocapsa_arctica.AAC.1